MELPKSIQFNGRTINFSFHNGTLSFMRDLGYVIDYNSNPLENLKCTLDVFLADFLLCAAKFYSRKESSFDYDRLDAFEWMDEMGGMQPIAEIFGITLQGKVKIPEGVVIPNETPKKLNSGALKK